MSHLLPKTLLSFSEEIMLNTEPIEIIVFQVPNQKKGVSTSLITAQNVISQNLTFRRKISVVVHAQWLLISF
jgi:hypothetical protein